MGLGQGGAAADAAFFPAERARFATLAGSARDAEIAAKQPVAALERIPREPLQRAYEDARAVVDDGRKILLRAGRVEPDDQRPGAELEADVVIARDGGEPETGAVVAAAAVGLETLREDLSQSRDAVFGERGPDELGERGAGLRRFVGAFLLGAVFVVFFARLSAERAFVFVFLPGENGPVTRRALGDDVAAAADVVGGFPSQETLQRHPRGFDGFVGSGVRVVGVFVFAVPLVVLFVVVAVGELGLEADVIVRGDGVDAEPVEHDVTVLAHEAAARGVEQRGETVERRELAMALFGGLEHQHIGAGIDGFGLLFHVGSCTLARAASHSSQPWPPAHKKISGSRRRRGTAASNRSAAFMSRAWALPMRPSCNDLRSRSQSSAIAKPRQQ